MIASDSKIGNILYHLYAFNSGRLRQFILNRIERIENGHNYSVNMRKIFSKYHKVEIGMYSMGGCFSPSQFGQYSKIGRYCSIAMTARIINRNHPVNFKSTHAFFFNPVFNFCKKDIVEHTPIEIGNDVWLGHNCIIMPNVRYIGDGAIVAAGAVINKDIPPYAIMVGNPARIVRYRFSKDTIDKLLLEKWWEKDIDELKNSSEYFDIYENNSDE